MTSPVPMTDDVLRTWRAALVDIVAGYKAGHVGFDEVEPEAAIWLIDEVLTLRADGREAFMQRLADLSDECSYRAEIDALKVGLGEALDWAETGWQEITDALHDPEYVADMVRLRALTEVKP